MAPFIALLTVSVSPSIQCTMGEEVDISDFGVLLPDTSHLVYTRLAGNFTGVKHRVHYGCSG